MNNFALEIWYDETDCCIFYTVRKNGVEESETDRFFTRYEDESHPLNSYANELLKLIIRTIGNRYGAIDDFFDRHERKAQALPPKYKKRIPEISFLSIDFPLRLYCYRISKDIVVLFNGGYKDKRNAQESKEVSMCFYEAQIYTERIADALKSGMILIDKREKILKDFQSNTEIEF